MVDGGGRELSAVMPHSRIGRVFLGLHRVDLHIVLIQPCHQRGQLMLLLALFCSCEAFSDSDVINVLVYFELSIHRYITDIHKEAQ